MAAIPQTSPNLPQAATFRTLVRFLARETFGLLNHMFSGEVKRWIILMDIFVQCLIWLHGKKNNNNNNNVVLWKEAVAQKLKNVLIKNYLKERELAARGSHRGAQTSLLTVRQSAELSWRSNNQSRLGCLQAQPTLKSAATTKPSLFLVSLPPQSRAGLVDRDWEGGAEGTSLSVLLHLLLHLQNHHLSQTKIWGVLYLRHRMQWLGDNRWVQLSSITAQMIKLDVWSCPTALPQARTGHLNVVPQLVRLALGEHWELRQKQICHSRSHIFRNTKETYFLSGSSGNASRRVQKVHKIRIS